MILLPDAALTTLLQVERDGNPLRKWGHASPFIGKLAPLDPGAMNRIGLLVRQHLPELPEPTLVVGMTESSLLLSYFVARWQQKPVDLRFTTRENRGVLAGRTFQEPHSHGPQHFLALPHGKHYAQILVIEDELTTGATLRNLLLCLRDVATRAWVVTLRDMRTDEMRAEVMRELEAAGVTLKVLDLSKFSENQSGFASDSPRAGFNPFGRSQATLEKARADLETAFETHRDAFFPIGECVDVALEWWLTLPENARPQLRQITRSPWKTDAQTVISRADFGGEDGDARYYLYNLAPLQNQNAVWIGEAQCANIGAQLESFLKTQGVAARGVTIAREN